MRLLLVDDERDFVDVMAKRLKARGLNVAVAYNGEQAQELARGQTFDVAVLDMLMPGIDGMETMRRLKDALPTLECIMLTGHGTIESAVEGMKTGAFDYLLKPCEFDDLWKAVQLAFDRKVGRDQQRMEESIRLATLSPREALKRNRE